MPAALRARRARRCPYLAARLLTVSALIPSRLRPAVLTGCALALLALLATPAAAQMRAVQLTSDNDAYDFWIPPEVRPDVEYSNGIRFAVELEGAPRWRRLAAALVPCARAGGGADSATGCTTTTVEVGHRMYMPRYDSPVAVEGVRHFAGWLYAAAQGHAMDGPVRHTVSLEVGVTGPPSLGERLMETLHHATGLWDPEGWRHQLGFEPALALGYQAARRAELRLGRARVGDATATAGATLGTLRTSVHTGARLRAGYRLPHPWAVRAQPGMAAYVLGGADAEVVGRDLFLDGNTFGGDGARVRRRTLVGQTVVGLGVALGGTTVEYRVTHRGRTYHEEPGGHPYGSIEITWRR